MRTIYGSNDWRIERDMTGFAATSGDAEEATGLTGGIGFLSATKGGPAIDGSLQTNLTQRSAAKSRYFGVIQGDDLAANLTDGQILWESVQFGEDYEDWLRVRYRSERPVA